MARSTDTDDDTVVEASDDAEASEDAEQDHDVEQSNGDEPEEDAPARSEATDELWQEVRIDPIQIALPRDMVGYTLRAYRPKSDLTLSEAPAGADADDDVFAERERARAAEEAGLAAELEEQAASELEETAETGAEEGDEEEETDEEEELAEADEAEAEAEEPEDEDVPVFLSHEGKLLLFATPEKLVSFITSDAPHDLTQLDTWSTLVERVRPEDIVPTDEDAYELDLVVENLRGGHDVWDVMLLVGAAELARDLGYALRLEPVVTALAPGSPLDDLDDALRATNAGWLSGVFAKRRLRRMGAQQASLGWRTIIGKISGAVDWRD